MSLGRAALLRHGDLERVMLRGGTHARAKFWRPVLLPVIERYKGRPVPEYLWGDATA